MGEIAILHTADSRTFSCRLSSELAAEGHSVLRREAAAPAVGDAVDPATRADAVIVVWSPGMLQKTPMIESARKALARRALAPVRIGGVDPPASFAHLWPIDLDGWSGDVTDPRWQFVRDEVALAMRRSEIALSTAQISRPPALRQRADRGPMWRKAGGRMAAAPMRFIAPGAFSLAVVASVAVIATAQQTETKSARPATRGAPIVAYVEPVRPPVALSADGAAALEYAPVSPVETPEPEARPPASAPPLKDMAVAPPGDHATSEPVSVESAGPSAAAPPYTDDPSSAPVLSASAESDAAWVAAKASGALMTVASLEAAAAPRPTPSKDLYSGLVFRDCVDCPDMTKAGAVALSRKEVTAEQWSACVKDKACRSVPDGGFGRGAMPAINVSFEDAQAYVKWLSAKTGWRYRLPTEEEWTSAAAKETAAIAPSTVNYAAAPWRAPLPTGSFSSSEYGLYDMRGNVWEWTEDCAVEEGGACKARVLKGGAFDAPSASLAPEASWRRGETARGPNIGFRVARE